jgi:regulator of PEP synthase PpsR (kinase-PPPase family)
MQKRMVYFISDGTGITAETLGHSLLSQFSSITFVFHTLSFIDTIEKSEEIIFLLSQIPKNEKPIVITSIVNTDIRKKLKQANAFFIDIYDTFLSSLENELHLPSENVMGQSHGILDTTEYNERIEAVNFSLAFDDGSKSEHYEQADIILVGVSRSGKTPTCLYLALQYGIRAANYPFTPEDLDAVTLPKSLKQHKKKLIGLTIQPERLSQLRQARKPNSSYAELYQCKKEIKTLEAIYQTLHIPYLNSTSLSIEELSSKIMMLSGVHRKIW